MKIILFKASWCGPCKKFLPVFREYVESNSINYQIVDIDEQLDRTTAAGVQVVPTMIVENEGLYLEKIEGPLDAKSLKARLDQYV